MCLGKGQRHWCCLGFSIGCVDRTTIWHTFESSALSTSVSPNEKLGEWSRYGRPNCDALILRKRSGKKLEALNQ